MAAINKPAQPLIAPTDLEDVEAIAGAAAEAAAADAIASDTTHAPLVNDLVPAANLPSYVDDVLEFSALEAFPAEGEAGKIYVALDTNNTYRWADTTYVQVGGSEIDLTPYALKTEVAAKADASDLETLAGVVAVKADSSTVVALADTVATKADASAVAAKADSATVAALAEEVAAKANAAAIQEALAEMEDEIAAKAGSAAIEELEAALANKANKPVNTIEFLIPDGWDGDFKDLLESQDTEFMRALFTNAGVPMTKSLAYFDQLGNYYEFWATSENSADVHIKPNVSGQREFADIPRTLSLLITSVSIQTDAETGDSWVLVDEIKESSYATYQDIEGKQDKPYNILADWAPKDLWDGSLEMLLQQQDVELVKAIIDAGFHIDEETGDEFYHLVHFVDIFGNKYTVEALNELSADFYIEWNYGHNITDGNERTFGVPPVQKWHVILNTDAETGDTQTVWSPEYESRYATIEEIGGSGSASVTPEAVAEAMSELEATDDDIDSLFDF